MPKVDRKQNINLKERQRYTRGSEYIEEVSRKICPELPKKEPGTSN